MSTYGVSKNPDRDQRIVMAWFGDLTVTASQIAEREGCTEQTVHEIWGKAKRRGEIPKIRREHYARIPSRHIPAEPLTMMTPDAELVSELGAITTGFPDALLEKLIVVHGLHGREDHYRDFM